MPPKPKPPTKPRADQAAKRQCEALLRQQRAAVQRQRQTQRRELSRRAARMVRTRAAVQRVQLLERAMDAPIVNAIYAARDELVRAMQRSKVLSSYQTARLGRVQVELKAAMGRVRNIDKVVDAALRSGLVRVGEQAVLDTAATVESLNELFGRDAPVNIQAARIMASGKRETHMRIKQASGNVSAAMEHAIERQLAISSLKSESFAQATQRIQRNFGGIIQQTKHAAERIVRTESMHAYGSYHLEGLRDLNADDPGWVMRIDASADLRRCVICASMDGQIADVLGGKEFTAHFQGGAGKPKLTRTYRRSPFHPHCRCVMTPWRPEWGDNDSDW